MKKLLLSATLMGFAAFNTNALIPEIVDTAADVAEGAVDTAATIATVPFGGPYYDYDYDYYYGPRYYGRPWRHRYYDDGYYGRPWRHHYWHRNW